MHDEPFADAPTMPPEAAQPAEEPPWAGQIIDGRYRLIRKLGEGGMGAVFLAEHLKLHKQVALKTIHRSFDGHAEVAARFAREAMASARIEHPHVVSALDYGTLADGSAFLVMQLARGEGLRERMQREGAMPFELASLIIEQMADALAAAHAANIVHRDLKPENVVLEAAAGAPVHVRVLDFGIAHLRSEPETAAARTPSAPLTRLGVVMGTPGYMAPEQAMGQPVDERTDLYALGVMLWELCAGRPPFEGDSLTAIVTQQLAASPPTLPENIQGVPAQLGAYLSRLLAPQPEDRPASAAEVRDRLRALRNERAPARAATASITAKRVLYALAALGVALLLAVWMRRGEPGEPARDASSQEPVAAEAPSAPPARRPATRTAEVPRADPPPEQATAKADAPRTQPAASASKPVTRRSKAGGRREGVRSRVRRTVDAIFR